MDYFDLVQVYELGDVASKQLIYHIHSTEKNALPLGSSKADYGSKGFYLEKTIQDFPIRGKAVYLVIKRRRWRNKGTAEEIKSDYSFIAAGSKITQELSDFSKGTGRDPRRHH